jgi:hypothetical protein
MHELQEHAAVKRIHATRNDNVLAGWTCGLLGKRNSDSHREKGRLDVQAFGPDDQGTVHLPRNLFEQKASSSGRFSMHRFGGVAGKEN